MTDRGSLDNLLPHADIKDRHQLVVAAPPDRVWQALKTTTLREMPLVWLLFMLRSLPARLTRNSGLPSALDAPLFTQMAARGFALLAEDPGRELVVGHVGQMWRLRGGRTVAVGNGSDFMAFDQRGYVKAAMSFRVTGQEGGSQVETETRALATDPGSRRRFARYWHLIRLGSGAIRRSWLRAAARRAARDGPMTGRPAASRRWMILRLGLVVVLAAAAGMVALVGVAAMSARPVLFLGAGLIVFLTATAAGVALATRRLPERRRGQTRLIAFAAGALAGMVVFGATVLLPVGDPRLPPAPVAGQRYWELPTGSRIAYVHLPAQGPRRRPTPVVFLHGGPGLADMAGDAAYFGQLTRDGFDVWVYDQVGTGRSSRLQDPRQYTIARNVADLEAIRRRIGADRMIMVGHSWGGQVAAGYLAAHPGHVARVVFSSPGALAPALDDGSDAGVRTRLSTSRQLGQYLLVARPRVLLTWTLLQINPLAAYAFVGDAEMDARNDRVDNHGRVGAHCRGAPAGPALHGLGFYAFQFPQSAAGRPWADPRPALARLPTPALVIKGSCDYLSWATGVDYWQALPNAQLVYLRRAGHNAYQDQPAAFLGVLRAFLAGRPLPIAPWTGGGVPADYEGPAGHPVACPDGCPSGR